MMAREEAKRNAERCPTRTSKIHPCSVPQMHPNPHLTLDGEGDLENTMTQPEEEGMDKGEVM